MRNLDKMLADFVKKQRLAGKGSLSVVLVITRMASKLKFPLKPDDLLTEKGGQVKGLGKAAVQNVLNDYNINRVLSEEGGRTSRGSINTMRSYVQFLNELHKEKTLDFPKIEKWWVARVNEFFAGKPFKFKIDSSKSIRSAVRELMEQAFKRQKAMPGMMFAGAVFQHLVGAKLELILPSGSVKHNGFSVADAPTSRGGDFLLDDVCIHVTTTPAEALMQKCKRNLENGLRPLVITTAKGVAGIELLSSNEGIEGRVDVFEIEQFVASNIYEISKFTQNKRRLTVEQLIEKYNAIVEDCETDPSLKIQIG